MSILVCTTSYETAWKRLVDCHRSGRSSQGPWHLRLLGQTGVGKTFLLERYVEEHPPIRTEERYVVPVLLVPIPSAPTQKGLYLAVLAALGAHAAGASSLEALRHRAITLIKNLGVEFLMLDELNHVLDRGQRRTREAVGDAIKQLVDAVGLPTVFAGAKRADQLFAANAQLRSRATASLTMKPFDLSGRFAELRGFIKAFLGPTHTAGQCDWMVEPDIATRIFYATDGMHRQVSQFLAAVPLWTPLDAIAPASFMHVLKQVFRETLWESAPEPLNPFSDVFVYRRLDRKGEPYAPTALDGDNHSDLA